MKKRKRLIRKLRVTEVSLAIRPANDVEFIIKKDQGGCRMDKLTQLVAMLAAKAETPEVVKEELKDFMPAKAFSPSEVAGILKDAGIEIKPKIVTKEVNVDKILVDGKEVDIRTLAKDFETYRGKVEVLQKEISKMEEQIIRKELEARVSKETADELFDKYHDKLDKDEIIELADKFAGLSKLADDMKGKTGEPKADEVVEKEVEDRVQKIMKDRGISRTDAIVVVGEESPDLIRKWR